MTTAVWAMSVRRALTITLVPLLAAFGMVLGVGQPAQAAGNQLVDGPNGSVNAIAVDSDGTVYVGGSFTGWGPQTGTGAVVNATTAQVNRNFPPITGTVQVAASDGSGGWYLAGNFSAVGGVARSRLAHILATGALDPNWIPNPNGNVQRMSVSGTTVYVGGGFTSICGTGSSCGSATTRNYLAAINADGTLGDWNPNPNSDILGMTVAGDGSTIYVGGNFATMCGAGSSCDQTAVTRTRLAAIGADGTLKAWNPMPGGGNGGTWVRSLALSGDGTTVYVGGNFATMCGAGSSCDQTAQSRSALAAIGTDGTLSTTWNPKVTGGYPDVQELAVYSSGSSSMIFAGGDFTTFCGASSSCGASTQTRNYVAAINDDGTLNSWNPNLSSKVWGMSVAGTSVYVAGEFTSACGAGSSCGATAQTRNRLAAFNVDGTLLSWDPNVNGTANTAAASGSTVYIGGAFSSMTTITRNRLAAVTPSGGLSTTFNPNLDNTVNALAVSGTTVYVGGAYGNACGAGSSCGDTAVTRSRLAAFGTDGTLDTTFNPNLNSTVNAMAVSGTTVYVGGTFTSACSTGSSCGSSATRQRLAAFGTDGSINSTFYPSITTPSSVVNAIATDGSAIYVGGSFLSVCGTSNSSCTSATARSRLAAFTSAGALKTWNPNANNTVNALAVSGSTVYVGGSFASIGGATRSGLAAIPTGSNSATSWNPGPGNTVKALVVSGNAAYVGGDFPTIAGALNGATQTGRYAAVIANAGLPGAPTGVQATPGDGSATVVWTAPANAGGSSISGYRIDIAPGPAYTSWSTAVANTGVPTPLSYTINGLTDGQKYMVRVAAINGTGAGAVSLPSTWFAPVAASVTPAVPADLVGVAGNGKIDASWTPVTSYGTGATSIIRYRAFAFTATGTMIRSCDSFNGGQASPPSSCSLKGLTNGQNYTIKVRAFNNLSRYSDVSPAAGPYTPSAALPLRVKHPPVVQRVG